MENRKFVCLVLIIVGIVMIIMGFNLIIGVPCIIGGIYFSKYPKSIPGWRGNIEIVKKRSKIIFMVGTIIIGLAILAMWVDIGLRSLVGWVGIYLMFTIPAYFFGLLLVVYSIHLIGNKWGWLDFPIAIVIFDVALNQIADSLEIVYRLAWFLVFPLNYVALLILFLATISKKIIKKEVIKLDEEFIDKWANTDIEEYEYNNIIKLVKNDIETENTITKDTFERIINWKSARSKGYTRKREYEEYKNTFTKILSVENKLEKLEGLYGIGVPIASTILHFIYPDIYPIIDVRTIETLQSLGDIDKDVKRDTIKGYYIYRTIILDMSKKTSRTLREIDKALFKFHKIKSLNK
ncbi:MAG: hypothetical protein CEE43_18985 [Promethearchaeota archaeon Loki_b32]|nr:MAG: hypothetical protein CEE43_18985 [Candidatus Lokiarchaeota archaeon Loki_b32]